MTFADRLRSERDSAATAYHMFIYSLPDTWGWIHAFYEGSEDQSFYNCLIKRELKDSDQVRTYVCGGRAGVLGMRDRVRRHPRPPSASESLVALFFIDRDFSGLLDGSLPLDDDIYVTDYHSIENYIVSEHMLQTVWTELLHCIGGSEAYRQADRLFQRTLHEFYEHNRAISAWVLHLAQCGVRANLPNLDLSRLFRMTGDLQLEVICSDVVKTAEELCNTSTPPGFRCFLLRFQERIEELSPKAWVRGKHELWLFVEFIKQLRCSMHDRDPDTEARMRVQTPLTHQNAVEVLGPRVIPPDSLREYLRRMVPLRFRRTTA